MGFWDAVTDLVEAATPWATVEAEAPPAEEKVRIGFVGKSLLHTIHSGTFREDGSCKRLRTIVDNITLQPHQR